MDDKPTQDPEKDAEKQVHDEKPPQQTSTPKDNSANDSSLVEFDGPNDPDNPKNWSVGRRIGITISMGLMGFVVTFSSSIFAVAVEPVAEEYNISTVTATLGVSLFLLVSSTRNDERLNANDSRALSLAQLHLAQQARCMVGACHCSMATSPLPSSTYQLLSPRMSKRLCWVAFLEGSPPARLWQ